MAGVRAGRSPSNAGTPLTLYVPRSIVRRECREHTTQNRASHVIQSFRNQGTEDVYDGNDTRAARRICPQVVWNVAARRLTALDNAENLQDLRQPPGNHLEALQGDPHGQHSIRINDQFRICFRWTEEGPEDVEIVDYH